MERIKGGVKSGSWKALALTILTISSFTKFNNAFTPNSFITQSNIHKPAFSPVHVIQTKPVFSPSETALSMGKLEDLLQGTNAKAFQKLNENYINDLQKRVEKINALEPEIEELGDDDLAAKTQEFRKRLKDGEDLNGKLLEEAFAVVREAAWCVNFHILISVSCLKLYFNFIPLFFSIFTPHFLHQY